DPAGRRRRQPPSAGRPGSELRAAVVLRQAEGGSERGRLRGGRTGRRVAGGYGSATRRSNSTVTTWSSTKPTTGADPHVQRQVWRGQHGVAGWLKSPRLTGWTSRRKRTSSSPDHIDPLPTKNV